MKHQNLQKQRANLKMKKPNKISFDMDEIDEVNTDLIEVKQDFYTKSTSKLRGSLRFSIPKPIVHTLNLQASDDCYFVHNGIEICLSFKEKPEGISEQRIKHRQLAKAGDYETLYVCIPPAIKNLYHFPITAVQILQPKGYKKHEWIIKPITTDYI